MAAQPSSARTMLTAFFAAEHIAAAARRTGLVQRASTMTGQLLLALVTFGVWSAAHPSRAPWAAKVTPWADQLERSPAAIDQRMPKGALAFLQDMSRPALATVYVLAKGCEDGLFPGFPKVYLAESTGLALPDSLPALLPGSGGRAAQAGAKMQAVWD